jgi:hypothetical protein
MYDPHFDHRSAKRFDQQRATGPFGVDEILPKKIATWVNRKHPDTGKRQTLLNFVEWQRGQAVRILQDFELHTYEWTLTAVKHRESLDKQDKRDVAQSVFAQDRDGRLAEHIAFLRAQTLEQEDDDQGMAEQVAQNLAAFRFALIDDLVASEENDVNVNDRALLMTGTEMTRTEFDLLLTLIRVFDHARSHFVFEICEPSTRRFLNALRIRHEEGGDRMAWIRYKTALLERMQNSSTIDGLISFILKPRDNNCPISLWVAERIAERRLLNEDEIDMSEDTWLELVLAFVTNEEKQTLQVPARDQRANFDEGAGYNINVLQQTLGRYDPATFKKFQQGHCHDPVAVRVIALHRLVAADKAGTAPKGKAKQELEAHALAKDPDPRSKAKLNDRRQEGCASGEGGKAGSRPLCLFPGEESQATSLGRCRRRQVHTLQWTPPSRCLPQASPRLGGRLREGGLLLEAASCGQETAASAADGQLLEPARSADPVRPEPSRAMPRGYMFGRLSCETRRPLGSAPYRPRQWRVGRALGGRDPPAKRGHARARTF